MSLRLATLSASLLCAVAAPVHAHGGHGAATWHWHATDTVGFLLVAVLAGAAVWFTRGKRRDSR